MSGVTAVGSNPIQENMFAKKKEVAETSGAVALNSKGPGSVETSGTVASLFSGFNMGSSGAGNTLAFA